MITDVFLKRYEDLGFSDVVISDEFVICIRQIAHVIFDDLLGAPPQCVPAFDVLAISSLVIRKFEREYPVGLLDGDAPPYYRVAHVLTEFGPERINDCLRIRLSLIELLLQETSAKLESFRQQPLFTGSLRDVDALEKSHEQLVERSSQSFAAAIEEINARFRQADLPFHYHNGLIQLTDDELIDEQLSEPFWDVVGDSKWKNVDEGVKASIDKRDSGDGQAAFDALKALESAIKIISDDKGFSSGQEKGAANYIDNLGSRKNAFIQPWERELLKNMFSNCRNPMGHGPGAAAPLSLSDEQNSFLIENCMAWIKSLIRRA